MKISIIIPVKPGGFVAAVAPLQLLNESPVDYEVIVAEGKKPSRQRNVAAEACGGDILYFLDDDSAAVPDVLQRLADHFADETVAVVGGPSLTHQDNTPFQLAIAHALASLFGGGGIRNRYRKHGTLRETDDSELILCNLAFRRDVFLAAGGLDERLYPNEENKLIDRLLADGCRLLHDPDIAVVRSQRPTLKAFVRQMVTYGRGRAEQTLLTGSISFKPMIPAFFFCYLVTLPFIANRLLLVPLLLYLSCLVVSALSAIGKMGFAIVCRLPMVYTLLHLCYGAGYIAGLISPRYRNCGTECDEPLLRRVKEFSSPW